LAPGQDKAAASEIQKVINHSGIVWNCWTGAMAKLGVARAHASQAKTRQGADADADRVRALATYKDFPTCGRMRTRTSQSSSKLSRNTPKLQYRTPLSRGSL